MSGVSSSSSDYQRANDIVAEYREAMRETEDAQAKENKATQALHEKQINDLEESYKAELRKKDEAYEARIASIRNEAGETLAKSKKELSRDARDAEKRIYDKFGRVKEQEVDELRKQVKKAEHDFLMSDSIQKDRSAVTQNQNEKRVANLQQQLERESGEAIQEIRDAARKHYDQKRVDYANQDEEYQKQIQNRYNSLNRERISELNAQAEAQHSFHEAQRAMDHRYKEAEVSSTRRIQALQDEMATKQQDLVMRLSAQHGAEVDELKNQLNRISQAPEEALNAKAEGRADAFREMEGDHRLNLDLIQKNNALELKEMKQDSEAMAARYAAINERNMHDDRMKYTKLLQDQQKEFHTERKDTEKSFDRANHSFQRQLQQDREYNNQRQEEVLKNVNEVSERARIKQADAFRTTLENQRNDTDNEINHLQHELTKVKSTDDVTLLSPAAEGAIRKSVIREYEKLFKEESERTKRFTDGVRTRATDELQALDQKHQSQVFSEKRRTELERHSDRNQFNRSMMETEERTQAILRAQQEMQNRELDRRERGTARVMADQRRKYEDIVETTGIEAKATVQSVRQDAEFEKNSIRRKMAQDRDEIIRRYERELEIQKENYESAMAQKRNEFDKTLNEQKRESSNLLETTTKTFEHQIKTMRQQYEERERFLVDSYEDRIEKIGRGRNQSKS